MTHAFDQNARAISLNFTQTAGGLNVSMPSNRNDVPPGYYMLFIVNGQGVPSVASFVRFPAPYEDTTAPTAPTGLTATRRHRHSDAELDGGERRQSASTGYNVHRSTRRGFTPSAANRVGQTARHRSPTAASRPAPGTTR